MKKIYAFLFTLLLASGAAAQNPTAYFMEGSTLRSQFNPAFAPLRGYVNIPGLGGLDINVSGNLSIDKILYPRNGKLVTLSTAPYRRPTPFRDSKPTTSWVSTRA